MDMTMILMIPLPRDDKLSVILDDLSLSDS